MKNNFFDGAPHRPLQKIRYKKKKHFVASTGPSLMLKVMEGLEQNGGQAYVSPMLQHWLTICAKYNISPSSGLPKSRRFGPKAIHPGRPAPVITAELLALIP